MHNLSGIGVVFGPLNPRRRHFVKVSVGLCGNNVFPSQIAERGKPIVGIIQQFVNQQWNNSFPHCVLPGTLDAVAALVKTLKDAKCHVSIPLPIV